MIVFVVKALAEPDLGGRVKDAWVHGATTMVLGPFGVFLGVVVLLVVGRRRLRARSGACGGRSRSRVSPSWVSVSIFGLLLPVIRQAVQRGLDTDTALVSATLAGPVVVIVLSVVEAIRLHRLGVTVGGPPPVANDPQSADRARQWVGAGANSGRGDADRRR